MNLKKLKLFVECQKILPRYLVKLGEYYQLIGVTKNNKPYAVEDGMTRRVSDMPIEKNELARIETWEVFVKERNNGVIETKTNS